MLRPDRVWLLLRSLLRLPRRLPPRLAALLLLLWPMAAAGAGDSPRTIRDGLLSVTFENDTVAATDRYYTSGLRVAWQPDAAAPVVIERLARALGPLFPPEAPIAWGAGLGLHIYTPRNKNTPDPPRDDRPYAGWLYGVLALTGASERDLGTIELALGVIGPSAYAEEAQDLAHSITGASGADGWNRQIGDRPAVLLTAERRWAWQRPLVGGLDAGLVPALGVHLGNVQTAAAAGLLVRVGSGLEMDFGPPRMRPSLSGLGVFRPPPGVAWYLFGGVEGRAVAYDATLDGNDEGYWTTDSSPVVGEATFGLALAWRGMRASLSAVYQSETFESQSYDPFIFGSLNLSIRY